MSEDEVVELMGKIFTKLLNDTLDERVSFWEGIAGKGE